MKTPIQSVKHYVQMSLFSVTGGASLNTTLVDALARDAAQSAISVIEGAVVKAVFVEIWLKAGEASNLGTFGMALIKCPDRTFPVHGDMVALHDYTNKKNIFYYTQGLINTEGDSATPVFRGWLKIPKGKQRFGLGDRLLLVLTAQTTTDLDACGFATYKEYT